VGSDLPNWAVGHVLSPLLAELLSLRDLGLNAARGTGVTRFPRLVARARVLYPQRRLDSDKLRALFRDVVDQLPENLQDAARYEFGLIDVPGEHQTSGVRRQTAAASLHVSYTTFRKNATFERALLEEVAQIINELPIADETDPADEMVQSVATGSGDAARNLTERSANPEAAQNQPGVLALPLGDPRLTSDRFGLKAAILSRLAAERVVPVPEGWCISLPHAEGRSPELDVAVDTVSREIEPRGSRFIVRSSASVEDRPNALFAGRFVSVANVSSRAGLAAAVETVRNSASGIAVRDYIRAHKFSYESIDMSVLVQRQVEAQFAGITSVRHSTEDRHRIAIEFVDGPSKPLLNGTMPGARYELDTTDSGGVEYRQVSGPVYSAQKTTRFLPVVLETCRRVADKLGSAQAVEWIWDGERVWVVQTREIPPQELNDETIDEPRSGFPLAGSVSDEPPELKSLPKSREWGLKGAAEEYFARLGRGASNCMLVFPMDDPNRVVRDLLGRSDGEHGTVLRFSYRAQVGLPRRFVPPGGDVVDEFMAIWGEHPEWMGIVSDYVFIESSFEAYISSTSLLVEHVPGNWETGNKLEPDLFLIGHEDSEAYRFSDYRLAKVEIPSDNTERHTLDQRVPPLTTENVSAWARQFAADFRQIRQDFAADLPVNVHFVSDASGRFYFLNIRPTRRLELEAYNSASAEFKANRMVKVERPNDVANWDGVAKIFVDAVADRGHESRIASVAASLRDAGVRTVHCTFGLLSHPAMVLREFDLGVEPLYVHHDPLKLDVHW
jgi:hypothetical protein